MHGWMKIKVKICTNEKFSTNAMTLEIPKFIPHIRGLSLLNKQQWRCDKK